MSSVISRPQHRYLFENPETLQKLCEKVILPNMHFRALDEELFTYSPDEYIRLDLEGSNAQTRRRAACNLVHVLCEAFEGPVVTNFSTYIEHLLNEYANTPSGGAWTSKDAALLLVTTVASRGKTEKVTVINFIISKISTLFKINYYSVGCRKVVVKSRGHWGPSCQGELECSLTTYCELIEEIRIHMSANSPRPVAEWSAKLAA
ncbi:unnamed protein product [Trichobilharzia regenti]|nr:unnamed protein product [Trichobilharzia regenti]